MYNEKTSRNTIEQLYFKGKSLRRLAEGHNVAAEVEESHWWILYDFIATEISLYFIESHDCNRW